MRQGEIYMVRWDPSVGSEYRKTRPAVVLSCNSLLGRSNLVTCVPISSKVGKMYQDDILIPKDPLNNLVQDSIIKMHHISTFDRSRFIKYIGHIDNKAAEQIKQAIKNHFGL